MLNMVGRPDLAARPEIGLPGPEVPLELVDEIEAAYLAWAMQYEMREALRIAQENRVLGGAVYTVADTLADPNFRARGLWEWIEHPVAGAFHYLGRPAALSASPRPAARRAPLLDEHRDEVMRELEELERLAPDSVDGDASVAAGGRSLPLAGIRVLDMAVVWAGPFASQLMAEWGAEVIKMEPINTIQPQTRPFNVTREGWMGGNPDDPPWNRAVNFNCSALHQRPFTGDVRTPEGREAFLELVRSADVIVENNVPDTIDRLGLTYEELGAVISRLICVRMPGLGLTGDYRDYRCWGNHLEAMARHLILRSYPNVTPEMAGETYACDSVAGLTAAFAAVVALRHLARTGEGQQVEIPQAEAFIQLMGVEYLDYQMNDRVRESVANDHRTRAPHNVYRCTGDDRWIAIDVQSDDQWQAPCKVLGLGELGTDSELATAAGRWPRRRELDRVVEAATSMRSREELFEVLVAVGVRAGPVQDDGDAFNCPQLRSRDWFEPIYRDDFGTIDYPGRLFKFVDTSMPARRHPPKLGEDNEHVYRALLGYSAERVQGLIDAGLVGTESSEEALARGR